MSLINLVTADLGRHIVNGREILSGINHSEVFSTNYYSYSHPDAPFINHHWFYGVIVYSVYQVVGFTGLSLFNLVIATLAFGLILSWTYKKHGLWPTLLSGLLSIPLITTRTDVRPETLSLLGVALYFVVLDQFVHKKLSVSWLWILLLTTQLIWQNTHLFFVLGLFEVFIFWISAIINKKRLEIIQLGLLGIVSALVTLINPNGVNGALMPFRIFSSYGYEVYENQPLLFLLQRFPTPTLMYELLFAGIGLVGILSFAWFCKKKTTSFFYLTTFFIVLGIATFKVIRLESFWGLLGIPFSAALLALWQPQATRFIETIQKRPLVLMFASTALFGVVLLMIWAGIFLPFSRLLGLGLIPKSTTSVDFIKEEQLSGPIFNNYDIGGFLIFYLFPAEKVFVDNRPEAYPVDFFEEEYRAPQNKQEPWKQLDKKYHFNLIVFNRLDYTPWGQAFLVARIQDPEWAPIFVDDQVIIFLKNTDRNVSEIERLRLPAEMFGIRK